MKAGFIQFEPILGEIDHNIAIIRRLVEKTDAALVVLPELCNTGYHFISRHEVESFAEEVPEGITTVALCELAKSRNIHIVAGLIEKSGNRCFNASVLVGPSGYVATYRKLHLFFEETLWFDPGDHEPEVYDLIDCRVGMMICFDWMFPEMARIMAMKGADVICHCANLVLPYCQEAMITRCLENRLFAITANRTGFETRMGRTLRFTGASQITGPDGSVLYRADPNSEEIGTMDMDIRMSRNKSINLYNNLLKDRKTEYYGALIREDERAK